MAMQSPKGYLYFGFENCHVKNFTPMKSSTKWTVRILLIVGFGIPVIIEAVTFLGLVGRHIEGGRQETMESGRSSVYQLALDSPILPQYPSIRLDDARVWAMTDKWQLEMKWEAEGEGEEYSSGLPKAVRFDSIITRGKVVVPEKTMWKLNPNRENEFIHTWQLPAGERPAFLYFAIISAKGDTTYHEVGLSQITVQSGDHREN